MSKGQLPKAYLRLDPDADQHPDFPGLVLLMCAANRQRPRGRFQPETVLRILGRKRLAQWMTARPGKSRPDLIELEGGMLYLDGWDEWQEGDLTVGDRVRRLRERRSIAVSPPLQKRYPDRKPDRKPGRIPPSEALGRKGVRALGTNDKPKNTAGGTRRAAAVKGGSPPAAAGAPWVDYDPGNELEALLVKRCEELAQLVSVRLDEQPPDDDDRRLVLVAVTGTPGAAGRPSVSLDTVRGASEAWLRQSLRASDDFERDLIDAVHVERVDDDNPEPPAKPAEEA